MFPAGASAGSTDESKYSEPSGLLDPMTLINPPPVEKETDRPKTKTEPREDEKNVKKMIKASEQPSDAEVREHQELCDRLILCFHHVRFEEKLKSAGLSLTGKQMKDSTIEELKDHVIRVHTRLSSSGCNDLIQQGAGFIVKFAEFASIQIPGFNESIGSLSGWSTRASTSDGLLDSLGEMELIYGVAKYVRPETRMVFHLWKTAVETLQANSSQLVLHQAHVVAAAAKRLTASSSSTASAKPASPLSTVVEEKTDDDFGPSIVLPAGVSIGNTSSTSTSTVRESFPVFPANPKLVFQ